MSRTPSLRSSLALVLCLVIVGCQTGAPSPTPGPRTKIRPAGTAVSATPENVEEALAQELRKSRALRAQWANKTFEEFEAATYKEPFPGGKYIVNGDMAVADRKHLQEFFEENIKKEQPKPLTVMHVGGQDAIWNSTQKKQLTYCVSTTFGNRHATVVSAVQAATGAWSQVADVAYVYVPAQDASCNANNANVTFDVRPVNVNGDYLARAFFPNEPRSARNVLIDQTSFELNPSGKLTLVGILRHELGHTLGWRHEHVRPEAGACFEDTDFRPLTSYDRFSVMHYPQCNGGGDWSLTLTKFDQNGAACIYGPASGFVVDTSICQVQATGTGGSSTGTAQSQTFNNQSVARNEQKAYGPFTVTAGSVFQARMTGAGAAAGDPDLYVQFGQAPQRGAGNFACRPFLTGANETCVIDVPTGQTRAFVMVHGFAAGSYGLTVNFVGGQ